MSLCVMSALIAFACTNEPVQIQKQVAITVSPSNVLDGFSPYSAEEKEMYSDDNGTSKLRITALVYDENGFLVDKKETLLNDYTSKYTFSVATEANQDYKVLCFSSSVDGTLENIENEAYVFSGEENLKNLKVTQAVFTSFYSNWSVLGCGTVDLSPSIETITIDLEPATAFVYLLWSDIHANDSATGGTSTNSSSVYTGTATDLSGEKYTWDITIQQTGNNVVLKNLSPFFYTNDVTADTGAQTYEGYIENGYIIIPTPQFVGFEYEGVPAEMYGITKITEETIYVDDIKIKIANKKLVFETGFGTYIEGLGWVDVIPAGVEFTSKSGSVSASGTTSGGGIDEYYIGFRSNDILLYNQNNGFYYKTTLDQTHSYVSYISPADFPDSRNIYKYINLLPGEFEIYAKTAVGNDNKFYSEQTISIEAGKQYLMELDCNTLDLTLVQGTMKSVTMHSDRIKSVTKNPVHTDYVTAAGIPLVLANKDSFLW